MTIESGTKPEYKNLPPEQLRFDDKNPRFGDLPAGKTQADIQKYLQEAPHYALNLVDSLLENGFIPYEPLIVRRTNELNEYVVVEGNRRLAAVNHLRAHAAEYPGKQEKIASLASLPVIIFASGQEEVVAQRVYLGVRHLFGFREWPPISKAKFLNSFIKSEEDLERTVKELGIKRQEIRRYLIPFRLITDAKANIPKGEDFWKLGEALTRTSIKEYIQLDVDRKSLKIESVDKPKLARLLDFVYGKLDKTGKTRDPSTAKISDTRQLDDLGLVLAEPRARRELERGVDLETSLLMVETRPESVRRLAKTLGQLRRLLLGGLKLDGLPVERRLKVSFEKFELAAKLYIKSNATKV